MVKEILRQPTIRESAVVQTARELTGPFRSAAIYGANRLSKGRLFPSTNVFFDSQPHNEAQMYTWQQMPQILQKIGERFSNRTQRPTKFIDKDVYTKWQSAKANLQAALQTLSGDDIQLTDYMTQFDENRVLYYQKEQDGKTFLYPLVFANEKKQRLTNETLKSQLMIHQAESILVSNDEAPQVTSQIANNLAIENAIDLLNWQLNKEPHEGTIMRISSVANEFLPMRHSHYDIDGEMFTKLRHRGASSFGELQQVQNLLLLQSLKFDRQTGEIMYDPKLADIWKQTFLQAYPDRTLSDAEGELNKFAREKVYFELATQWLHENPRLVNHFRKSLFYKQFEPAFRDRNLSAIGLTETQNANAMLANYYLYLFEGGGDPQVSPSQKYLATIDHFHDSIASFIHESSYMGLPIPQVSTDNLEVTQREELGKLKNQLKCVPYQNSQLTSEQKENTLRQAEISLRKVTHETARHAATQPFIDKIGLISGEDTTLYHATVANVGMARVPGEHRFTTSSWFPHTDAYLSEGLSSLFPFDNEKHFDTINNAIRFVFNGETLNMGDGGISDSAYESQVARITQVGGQIFEFLQTDARVPEKIRSIMQTVGSTKEYMTKALEVCDDISHHDPHTANRFFPEGFEQFQLMTMHRYVTDFLRGVETELIKSTKSMPDKMGRRFGGKWKNYDFSNVNEELLQQAVDTTLAIGEHRAKKLNHEGKEKKTTLKDWQEFFEKALGWDTHEMKFLRWDNFMTIWKTMGPAWACICFTRKPLFNTGTMQQF